jgi:SNF2 family DNA or RNA helicase
MPGYLLSHGKFVKKYEKPIIKDNDKKALSELSKQIKPFIMRRMKKEVLTELPEKIETKMSAELTPEQNKIYLAYMHHIQTDLAAEIASNGYEKSQMKVLAALTRLRQICCHPNMFIENYKGDSGKMLVLVDILTEAIQSGHRILIFSQFTSMLKIISCKLKDLAMDYFYLDGNTKAEVRAEYVNRFNSGEKEIFLISLKAGGTGLNLTGADMVIHFDPWWNPAVEDQATDRAYRIGQNNSVQVIKLVTKNTIEEKIYELQDRKRELINSVIQPGETFINKMNEQDIKELFEL